MPVFVLRDVDAETWARLTRTAARMGLNHQQAIEAAVSYWCFYVDSNQIELVNMGGDTVASVPMGAST